MQPTPRYILRGLVIAAIGSAVVSAVLVVVSDGSEVVRALGDFDPLVLVWMLLMGAVGFFVRSMRWGALMRVAGHRVPLRDALYLQISGQAMTVTPGRVGEVVKPWLAREIAGMRMTRSVTLVFAERVADLIAVCLLALGGLWALGGATWTLVLGIVVVGGGTALAGSSWFHGLALRIVRSREKARKHEASAEAIADTLRCALHWRVLAWSVPASVVAWGLEGVGFALCLDAFGFDVLGALVGVSVYAVATIAGAFSFLPGGIGLTEASMAGILVAAGMPAAAASGATIVTRVATLWWGVALGWIALASRPRLLGRVLGSDAGVDEAP
ncbi:lysylphosphatidylglycerol synthase transmembrane domain-containing protein [Anaerosoma tenue]|uniref:lysylphosphatidylglycerol synthase transmembrane domain-containing protein n=1 Tax=Anaerosoma tenue TaxID=2933588 RepID=UPI002260814E|nr:lysylphosphatidylglycerol synthase transmembrane domain-containing protein [Anaerosoma tenue]MCK8115467.1 flippase-like domain-containing protein [Anaerosoma tenue]